MIANCNTLITKYSSVVYVGLALGKKVYSDFNVDVLTALIPKQNNGTSAFNIAQVCEYCLNGASEEIYNYDNNYLNPQPEF